MTKKKKVWIAVGVVLLIVILAGIFVAQQATSKMADAPEEAMDISVQKAAEHKIDETILVTGKIVPEDEQKIYPDPEKGDIKEFKVKENKKVKKGDTLFQYDSASLDREYEAAVRSRSQVQNSLESQQHEINKITKDIEDMKKAVNATSDEEETEEVATNDDVKEMELQKRDQSLELENTKAELASAQDEINAVDEQRKGLTVKAKLDGTVVQLNKNLEKDEEGSSEPVVHIVSSKPFKVVGTMSEFDAVKIEKEQSVNIIPKVYKDRSWKGEVSSVSQHPEGDDGEGMDDMGGEGDSVTNYPFTVNITDDTSDLRQGFHVTMEVSVGKDEKKLAIPHSALMDDMMMDPDDEIDDMGMMNDGMAVEEDVDMTEDSYVFVINEDDILEQRDIETGEMSDEFIEIKNGVEKDELVVINPTPDMYDGMEVDAYDEVE